MGWLKAVILPVSSVDVEVESVDDYSKLCECLGDNNVSFPQSLGSDNTPNSLPSTKEFISDGE